MSYLDTYSKYTWIYLLHNIAQASAAFTRFKSFSETQIGFKLQSIQTMIQRISIFTIFS